MTKRDALLNRRAPRALRKNPRPLFFTSAKNPYGIWAPSPTSNTMRKNLKVTYDVSFFSASSDSQNIRKQKKLNLSSIS